MASIPIFCRIWPRTRDLVVGWCSQHPLARLDLALPRLPTERTAPGVAVPVRLQFAGSASPKSSGSRTGLTSPTLTSLRRSLCAVPTQSTAKRGRGVIPRLMPSHLCPFSPRLSQHPTQHMTPNPIAELSRKLCANILFYIQLRASTAHISSLPEEHARIRIPAHRYV